MGRSKIIRVTGKKMMLVVALALPTLSEAADFGYGAGRYPNNYQQPGLHSFEQPNHVGGYVFRPPVAAQLEDPGQLSENPPSHSWSPSRFPEVGQSYKFRDTPTQAVDPYPVFRPRSRIGRSDYSWRADDGSIGPAPVFRPMNGEAQRPYSRSRERPPEPPHYQVPIPDAGVGYLPSFAPVAPKFRPIP